MGISLEGYLKSVNFNGSLISVSEYKRKYDAGVPDYYFNSWIRQGIVLAPGNPELDGLVFDIHAISGGLYKNLDLGEYVFNRNILEEIADSLGVTLSLQNPSEEVYKIHKDITSGLASYKVTVLAFDNVYVSIPKCYKKSEIRKRLKKKFKNK